MGHLDLGPLGSWDTWILGHLDLGPLGSWNTWILGHLDLGTLGSWDTWILEHLDLGTLGSWNTWILEHLDLGTLGSWDTWISEHLDLGTLGSWDTRILDKWIIIFSNGYTNHTNIRHGLLCLDNTLDNKYSRIPKYRFNPWSLYISWHAATNLQALALNRDLYCLAT